MVFAMFMRLIMMVVIFWILLHILTAWMLRVANMVMIRASLAEPVKGPKPKNNRQFTGSG
jgi:hypothetical protein